jgi:hypothetical protein
MNAKARTRPLNLRRSACALAVAAMFQPLPAVPAVVNWIDGTGFWDVAANWSGGAIPGAADDVIINVAGLPTVTYRTITSTINSLAITNATFAISSGALTVSNTFSNNSATNVGGGTLTLNGASTMASLNHTNGQISGTGTLTITGAANISLGGHSGSGTTIVQGATTISGTGLRLDGGRTFRNEGTVTQTGGIDLNNRVVGATEAGNGSVQNALGATWNSNTGSTILIFASSQGTGDTGAGATFTNAGTFNK